MSILNNGLNLDFLNQVADKFNDYMNIYGNLEHHNFKDLIVNHDSPEQDLRSISNSSSESIYIIPDDKSLTSGDFYLNLNFIRLKK